MTRLAEYQEHAERQHPGDLPKDLVGLTSITENGGEDASSPAAVEDSPKQPDTPSNTEPSKPDDPPQAVSDTAKDKEIVTSATNQPEVSSNGDSGDHSAASATEDDEEESGQEAVPGTTLRYYSNVSYIDSRKEYSIEST